MGLKIHDVVQQTNIFIFFSNAMLMQKNKYAKVKIIHAILKVNMDNYRCYLLAKVRIFKSFVQD
jgi:hypothetical protein